MEEKNKITVEQDAREFLELLMQLPPEQKAELKGVIIGMIMAGEMHKKIA